MAKLEVLGVTKTFGSETVLDGVSFEVEDGEFAILLGPSGCGKTTLLRVIAGLEEADRGEIRLAGDDVTRLDPKERDVAMVFQNYALYPHLTVFENLAFPLKARRRPRGEIERTVREAARLLEIEPLLSRRPKELSGGQRQRVAIGRAIVRTPRLFLYDEPLSNLDVQLRTATRVELAKLHRTLRATTAYVTHDQVEAMTLGDKIVLLDRGRVQQVATPRELYDEPANLFVATFVGSPPMNVFSGTLVAVGDELRLEAEGLRLPLPGATVPRELVGSLVSVGVRPESLVLGEGGLRARVELAERVGPETILHLRAGSARLAAKGPPDWRGAPGDEVPLCVGGRVHFFLEGRRVG